MSNIDQLMAYRPPHMFILEGIFLGYLGKKLHKSKAIILEVEQEQLVIKLPKEVRVALQSYQLQPGDQIRCIGRSQLDFKAGVIKLKAYQILPLTPPAQDTPSPVPPRVPISAPLPTSPTSPTSTIVASPRVSRPAVQNSKILVCRKSGCQKRGGRQLISIVEKTLQKHQLSNQVEIQHTGCQKRCSKAPTLTIMPGKHRYDRLNLKSLPTLLERHFCIAEPCSTPEPS